MSHLQYTAKSHLRNFKTRIFRDEQADISFNWTKQMWFYGFKVHMLVSLSGYVVNYLVTPASTHDSKACEELLEDTNFPIILADLGYISQSLKQRLAQKWYQLWTPLRQNMSEAKHHDNWKLMAKRRTIETRFSVLCTEFDIQRPLVRSLCGLKLWLESIIGFIIWDFSTSTTGKAIEIWVKANDCHISSVSYWLCRWGISLKNADSLCAVAFFKKILRVTCFIKIKKGRDLNPRVNCVHLPDFESGAVPSWVTFPKEISLVLRLLSRWNKKCGRRDLNPHA